VPGLWNGATRAILVVFGGLLTLQSSDRLDIVKIAYLLVAGIALAGSVAAVWRARREPSTIGLRPWLVASAIILGLVTLSLPVALLHDATITNWLRDAAAYVLLAAAPWLAIDLARSVTTRVILGGALLAGSLGVVSFAIAWVQRRALADLPIDRLTLPSMTLGAAAYCVAVAYAVRSRGWKRAAWILLSMAIVAAFFLTGTRTSFALLAAPLAVVLVEGWQRGRAGLRAGAAPVVAQFAAIAIVMFVAASVPTAPPASSNLDPSINPADGTSGPTAPDLKDRFSTLDDITSGRDQSLQLRIQQTRIAWEVFLSSPLVGTGLGHEFTYMPSSTRELRILNMDTPVSVLAKFGVLGLLLSGVLAAAFYLVTRAMTRRRGTSWRALTLIGYAAVLLALVPFGWPPEDKGTGLALVFVLALAAIDWTVAGDGHVSASRRRSPSAARPRSSAG
jgi:hypothetical protein